MKTQFLIAAPMSGSGKTTVARGLMGLFRTQGCSVQPFKCGPDYIDTKFHAEVCGRPSVNLDTFMATTQHVGELFQTYGDGADVCIVEGMMGLFDGYDRERGSSYEVARVLGLPVVLVVDARSAAYSMAALLKGFISFRSDVTIAGVIFNKVGSERHAAMLRQVCDELHMACYGCLPRSAALEQGSRYLGLDFTERASVEAAMQLLEAHTSWRKLGALRCRNQTLTKVTANAHEGVTSAGRVVCARNAESFSFLYQETLDRLQPAVLFDPETDVPCLDGADLLVLPGGYPEKHAGALARNEACRKAIHNYAERGGRIQAECGGMMYLCRNIVTDEGDYPMCGVLPYTVTARKADRRLSLGYRSFVLDGREYRGHEFHYTQFLGPAPLSAAQVRDARGEPVSTPVIRYKNVLASYTHLYAAFGLNDN